MREATHLWDMVVILAVSGLVALFVTPVRARVNERGYQTACGKNLAAIAKAGFQYATDWRFYPHLAKPRELDGGYTTAVSTRCLRQFIWDGQIESPETFVCPSSPDSWYRSDARGKSWLWRWPTGSARTYASPLVASSGDPTLAESTELSYGWTMRQITSSSSGMRLLAADKARRQPHASSAHTGNMIGNHRECMQATCLDGHIYRATPKSPGLDTSNIGGLARAGVDGGECCVLDDESAGG